MRLRAVRPLACLVLLLPLFLRAEPGPAPVLTVTPDHADYTYAPGETATWTVDVTSGERAALAAVPYQVTRDGQDVVAKGTLDLSAGPATFAATRADPGVLLATLDPSGKFPPGAKPLIAGGAIYAPEKFTPALPAPDDFDAFWEEKLKELAAVPPNPVEEKGAAPAGVDYYKVTLDNIRGTKVRGQLARPTKGDKFPAMLIVQWAGVYPLQKEWVVDRAKDGFLAMNVLAHDLPIDEKPEFYQAQNDGPLKGYTAIGAEDRETSYFLRMFLGDVQAAQYLAGRPDWDGRVLIVTGGSQGGLQSFSTAALYPKVTHIMVCVPAGCDVYGPLATPPRAASWPNWLTPWFRNEKDEAKVRKTAGYFDPIYFAARVKCPALVGPGLLDETARPYGIVAAFNALPNPAKELFLMGKADHHGTGQDAYYGRAGAWGWAIKEGRPVPPPK